MSYKNIIYFYDVCGLSPEAIASKYSCSVEKILEIISKPPAYTLQYPPRNRRANWVNGK